MASYMKCEITNLYGQENIRKWVFEVVNGQHVFLIMLNSLFRFNSIIPYPNSPSAHSCKNRGTWVWAVTQ